MRGENRLVGPGGTVERDLFLHEVLVCRLLRIAITKNDEGRAHVREVFAFPSRFAHALFCPRNYRLAEVLGAVKRVDVETIAAFAGHTAHVPVHTRDVDWDPWMFDGAGIEHRSHQVEAVEFALEVEPDAVLPAVPDGPECQHLFAKPRSWRLELHRKTPLVVAFHLRTESEDHASTRRLLEVPRDVRGDHRAARKREGDRRAKFDTLRCCGGDSKRQIWIVLCLRSPQTVVAHRLELLRVFRNRSQLMSEHAGVELHGSCYTLVYLVFLGSSTSHEVLRFL